MTDRYHNGSILNKSRLDQSAETTRTGRPMHAAEQLNGGRDWKVRGCLRETCCLHLVGVGGLFAAPITSSNATNFNHLRLE